jgi:hypothetical protein
MRLFRASGQNRSGRRRFGIERWFCTDIVNVVPGAAWLRQLAVRLGRAATVALAAGAVLAVMDYRPARGDILDNVHLYSSLDADSVTLPIADDPGQPIPQIFDSSGNGYHSLSNGGTPYRIDPSPRDTAISYPGPVAHTVVSNNGTNFGNILDPGLESYTVSLWFNADCTNCGFRFLASKGNRSSSDPGWAMFLEANQLQVRANYGSGTTTRIGVNTPVAPNTWYHAALVIDNSNGLIQGYLNGLGSGANGGENGWQPMVIGSPLPVTFPAPQNIASPQLLFVGQRNDGQGLLRGRMDDVRIYTNALSASDIATLAAGGDVPGAAAIWNFADPGGRPTVSGHPGVASDISLQQRHGTILGSVTAGTSSISGASLRFPRNDNSYVTYGTTNGNPGADSFSVSLWFKADSVAIATQFLASKGNAGSTDVGWSMWLANNSLHVRGQQVGGGSNDRFGQVAAAAVTPNEWHHVVMVIDRETNVIRGYLNGSNAPFINGGGGSVVGTLIPGSSISNALELLVGRRSSAGASFGGEIDDLAVWNRALSLSEVEEIYAAGLFGRGIDSLTGSLISADLNRDSLVNRRDVLVLLSNYGSTAATPEQGDIDGTFDGVVSLLDLAKMQRSLDAPPPVAAAAVAEPSSLGLAILAAGSILFVHRVRRKQHRT